MKAKKPTLGNSNIKDFGIRTRFQPGASGNPGGRPKTRVLAEMLAAVGNEIEPKTGKAYFQLAAEALVGKAFGGDVQAFKELADRVDGRSMQHVELSGANVGAVAFDSQDAWMKEWQASTPERRRQIQQELNDKILAVAAKIVAERNLPEHEKQYRARMREYHDRIAAGEKFDDVVADFKARLLPR